VIPTPPTYSRSQTLDLRSAMSRAVAKRLREAEFFKPGGGTMRFAQVFDHWAEYQQRYIANTAAVVPSESLYDAARLTPTLLEDTWEPRGEVGVGLYKTADIETEVKVLMRCPTEAERAAFIAGVEDLWVSEQVLMDHEAGPRYGVLLPMVEYWSICAGFALKAIRVIDDEQRAMRDRWEAEILIAGQAPQVKLGPVRPLRLTVRMTVER